MKVLEDLAQLSNIEEFIGNYDLRLHDCVTTIEDEEGYEMDVWTYARNTNTVADVCKRSQIDGITIDDILEGENYKIVSTFSSVSFCQEIFENQTLVDNIMSGKYYLGYTEGLSEISLIYETGYVPRKVMKLFNKR